MKNRIKYGLLSFLSIIIIIVGVFLYSNKMVERKVQYFLDNRLPKTVTQVNEGIFLNVFEGTITIKKPSIEIKNRKNQKTHTYISLEELIIEDVSYWNYLFKTQINIEDVKLRKANIIYYKDKFEKKDNQDSTSGFIKIYKPILIDELSIDNATLHIYDSKKDSLLLYVENSTIEIDDIKIDSDIIKKRLPVSFKKYKIEADSIFIKTNEFENLSTSSFKIKNGIAHIEDILLKTKYSKKELSKIIKKERDHFNLNVASLKFNGLDFGFKNRILYITVKKIDFNEANLNLFRDKLVADDTSVKKMYSESLRALPFNLVIDSIVLNEAYVNYTEKVKPENEGGTINFSNLNAKISNVSNTSKSSEKTNLDIDGVFMNTTPFEVNWSFDVKAKNDAFLFAMDMNKLELSEINTFTEPNLKVRLEGQTNKTYFTISGNKVNSVVDLKVNYEDLKINVLNKSGNKENWLLSTFANLLVSKDSNDKNNNFRESQAEVERDKTKSIFNFIWLNVSQGLLKSMAGDGESEKKK